VFHDILVAVDGSATAHRALEHAIDLAAALNARLTIVTVAPEVPAFARGAAIDVVALEKAAEDEADKRLREALELVPDNVSVTTILRHGAAAKEILKVSKERNYDLLVMGSRQRGRFVSNVLGSVAADVHFATTLPMLVVHPDPDAAEP
jgi:nucleotide-binding universal stress UspA family protein